MKSNQKGMRKLESSCMKSIKGGGIIIQDILIDGCFEESTQIRTHSGLKMIKDLDLATDKVWNPISKQFMGLSRRTTSIIEGIVLAITTSNGEVTVTSNHAFVLAGGQVVQAAELKAGDMLAGGEMVSGVQTLDVEGYMLVHNLVFDNSSAIWQDHMVEANGVVSGALYLQDSIEHRTAADMPALAFN